MSPLLKDYLNQRVVIITTDGQCLLATLSGFDKSINLLLSDVKERFTQSSIAGAYVLQGSQVVCCGPFEDSGSDSTEEVAQLQNTKNIVDREHEIWKEVWRTEHGDAL
ncbi:HBL234Cp [Eremothecium sinecaudum]|uniref:LSM2-LSM8 complex subunit LSM8 n=1 Tax=Eremothecium sinecaudum TaxID=45286 RepID=A0A109UWA4_9SACH|nr:HBL234Cp [Eremothecium sinecaudum]AMD18668.1 HBL234Cp [Eremothecium sinecaudum]